MIVFAPVYRQKIKNATIYRLFVYLCSLAKVYGVYGNETARLKTSHWKLSRWKGGDYEGVENESVNEVKRSWAFSNEEWVHFLTTIVNSPMKGV